MTAYTAKQIFDILTQKPDRITAPASVEAAPVEEPVSEKFTSLSAPEQQSGPDTGRSLDRAINELSQLGIPAKNLEILVNGFQQCVISIFDDATCNFVMETLEPVHINNIESNREHYLGIKVDHAQLMQLIESNDFSDRIGRNFIPALENFLEETPDFLMANTSHDSTISP